MVEELRQLFARAEQQPAAVQRHLAAILRREPDEALREIAAGEYIEYDEYARERRELDETANDQHREGIDRNQRTIDLLNSWDREEPEEQRETLELL